MDTGEKSRRGGAGWEPFCERPGRRSGLFSRTRFTMGFCTSSLRTGRLPTGTCMYFGPKTLRENRPRPRKWRRGGSSWKRFLTMRWGKMILIGWRRLGFAAGSFHGAWACASFLHIPHREALATMREIHRVLSPGGFLYLSVKEGEGQGGNEKGTFSAYYHAEELARLAREAGFEVLLLSEVPSHVVFLDLFARR